MDMDPHLNLREILRFYWDFPKNLKVVPSLKLTARPWIGLSNRKGSYSNHPFVGVNLLLVSGRVNRPHGASK